MIKIFSNTVDEKYDKNAISFGNLKNIRKNFGSIEIRNKKQKDEKYVVKKNNLQIN